jgi:hypothetical protein
MLVGKSSAPKISPMFEEQEMAEDKETATAECGIIVRRVVGIFLVDWLPL